jgi:hypothetical protein
VASRLLFCQKVLPWIAIQESLPSWLADDRSVALADAPRLLKGPKLLLAHATFVTDVTFREWFVGNQRPIATAHTDLVLEYARSCRVMGCNKPCRLTPLVVRSLLGSHFPALLLSHGNLPRSKVVENIAMVDYIPIFVLEITPCHSKSDGRCCHRTGEGRHKAPGERAGCKTTNLASSQPLCLPILTHSSPHMPRILVMSIGKKLRISQWLWLVLAHLDWLLRLSECTISI